MLARKGATWRTERICLEGCAGGGSLAIHAAPQFEVVAISLRMHVVCTCTKYNQTRTWQSKIQNIES